MNLSDLIEEVFKEKFNEEPLIVRSPGRVNLIGEHTDYNMGYVLPAAIDKSIYFAIAPREDRYCKIIALDMDDEYQFALNEFQPTQKGWPNYLMGVVDQFIKTRYTIKGFNCVFRGNIPIGAGLSSSAAIEAGLAFALNSIFELKIDDLSLVKLAQKAENEFVGVRCGIMDQYINIFGERENVLRIDCRSLEYRYYPFNHHNVSIVLFDTRVSHSLASSKYNRRREECSEGVAIIKKYYPNITHLRDVSVDMLDECKQKLGETLYQRCRYVVEENDRVLRACTMLEKGDLKSFGSYMDQTHEGLSYDYEVSCEELDYLVELVRDNSQVYGARMMGGGFGGCTINLIENEAIEQVARMIQEKYEKKFTIEPKIYVTSISAGTSILSVKEHVAS